MTISIHDSKWIQTSLPDFRMRFAEKRDVPLILNFVKELARYEKLSHEVVATEQQIEQYLFGKTRYAEVILGYEKDKPAGFALFFHNYSTFMGKPGIYLEDLFVKPMMRGNGYGRTLLNFLAKLAVERDCGRLEWSVLDWNEPAIEFYKKIGASAMDEWTVYRLSGEALINKSEAF